MIAIPLTAVASGNPNPMKNTPRSVAAAIALLIFAVLAAFYLTACTAAQKAQLRSDGKALLGKALAIGEAAVIRFTEAELKAAADSTK